MRTYPNIPEGVWALAVDYGTTNTVVAAGDRTGVRTLTFEGQTTLPSAVLLHNGGPGSGESWLVGHRAVNMAQLQIERFEGTPKRWISAGTVFLAGREIPVVDAVTAVLRVVVAKAVEDNGPRPPAKFTITHPADWPEPWIEVLREAARRARQRGWPAPETLTEPVAAAYRALESPQVPSEARIVVLDIGGGTVDVAVVDRSGKELTVIGRPSGMPGAAGETFDTRLAGWMTTAAGADGLYQRLTESEDHDDKQCAYRIRTTARAVKEELSWQDVVPAPLPAAPPELEHDTRVEVRRATLEELVGGGSGQEPGLTEAVAMVAEALQAAPQGKPFAGVLLVGGSSRIPLLSSLVRERSGKPAISEGDPSTAVADGAVARALDELDVEPRPTLWQRISASLGRRVTPPVLAGSVGGLIVLAALLIMGGDDGGGGGVTTCLSGTCTTTTQSPVPTTTIFSIPTTTPVTDPNPVLSRCPDPAPAECHDAIIAASRAAWPSLPMGDCRVNGPLYSVDPYSVECRASDTSYLVFWRRSGSVVSMIAGQMIMPTLRDFALPNEPHKLGEQAWGTRRTSTGDRYTCAWEYADYPFTIVIDGPNTDSTMAVCGNATFLAPAAMSAALGR
jgi:actin-like ATPase involved in cell morphogenesis